MAVEVRRKHYLLSIREIRQETAAAIQIIFNQPKAERLYFKAGQFLTLIIRKDNEVHYRSYSICSIPRLDDFIAIVIKKVPEGLLSSYLIDNLRTGQQVEVLPPTGRFFIENSVKFKRHLIMVAGGSGITPIMSMLQAVLYNEPHSKVSLLYANRNIADIIFHTQLKRLETLFQDRLSVSHFLSQPIQALRPPYFPHRLDADHVADAFSNLEYKAEASYFLCGPRGMMKTVHNYLRDKGIEQTNIHQEHFTQIPFQTDDWADEPVRSIKLTYAGKTHEIEVAPGATVLDAGIDAGLDMPFSCRSGNCATCMAKLKAGEIFMDNPQALLPFEKEKGYVLTCQSHPKGDDVEIVV